MKTQTATRENRLMAATLFAFFVSGAGTVPLGNLIPFFRAEYGLSYDFSGLLLSLQSTGNLIAIFLTGFLPLWVGRRKSVLFTSLWMLLAYIIFTTGFGGAALLPAACLMTGIAKGGNANFSNTMMSTLPGKKSAIGYNLLHGAFAIGALGAPLVLIACTSRDAGGWRTLTAGLCLLCAAQMAVYGRMALPAEPAKQKGKGKVDYSFLKSRPFWLASAILFFYISAEYAITGWMVTYFQDIGVLSRDISQMMSSLLWLVIFLGRMAGAALVGRLSRQKLLLADGVGLVVFFLLVFTAQSQAAVIFGIAGAGLFMATIYPSAMALGSAGIEGNDVGVSFMILAGSIGGILAPAAVGLVAEAAGIRAGMGIVVLLTALLLGAILLACRLIKDPA